MTDAEYHYIKMKISRLMRIDLEYYKPEQMMRRLDGFVSRTGAPGVVQYCDSLDRSQGEVDRLRNFLTINVSEFYRDSAHFGILQNVIFPGLLKKSPDLSIWSAGCSDGQEAYTIAMILDGIAPRGRHRILATDLDRASIARGSAGGPYKPAEVRNIPPALLRRFFTLSEGDWRAGEELRNKVRFVQHDLMLDRFEADFDLIICRNVTIYFSSDAKQTLKLKFRDSLKDRGVLFIGATETILDAPDIGFQRLFPCFYQRVSESPAHRDFTAPAAAR